MSDDTGSPPTDAAWREPLSAPVHQPEEPAEAARPPLHIGQAHENELPAEELSRAAAFAALHPLDRPVSLPRSDAGEANRIRLAWAKLLWLLSFLAVLLAISYLVPYIAENTQYALTRGRQRAEHDYAREHLPGSPLSQLSQAYQMVSQAVGPSVVRTTGARSHRLCA